MVRDPRDTANVIYSRKQTIIPNSQRLFQTVNGRSIRNSETIVIPPGRSCPYGLVASPVHKPVLVYREM